MTRPETIRVVIVEDHGVVLWGLQSLVDGEAPAMHVVGTARNCQEALGAVRQARPDVILLDLKLGGESGLDLLPRLREEAPEARVLVVTGVHDEEAHLSALRHGASGVVPKDASAEVVLRAIRKVHGGEVWFDRAAAYGVLTELIRSERGEAPRGEASPTAAVVALLTPKEREIITVIVCEENSTNRQMAHRLRISENTLRNHLSSIYDKLGVRNRLELLKFALSHGLA